MDAEPKALRLSIILTIAFVLFGIIAASYLLLIVKHPEPPAVPGGPPVSEPRLPDPK